MIDLNRLTASLEAGNTTVAVMKEEMQQPIPLHITDPRLTITTKMYDTYTGEPVDPMVQTYRKSDLMNQKVGLQNQMADCQKRMDAIDELLANFE